MLIELLNAMLISHYIVLVVMYFFRPHEVSFNNSVLCFLISDEFEQIRNKMLERK